MNLFSRHKNTVVLATVLLAQLLALAVQVKRQTAEGPVRVIRLVAVNTLAPFERMLIYTGESARGVWSGYIDLRNVRKENLRLKAEAAQMRLERAREQEDARQARRIQSLLGFKEQWIDTTVAAQVIGTSGTESSRLLYLDKGAADGIKVDMPVITPDGVAGKILAVYGDHNSQMLVMNDPTSGVGATLVTSRLQGIVKGTPTGEVTLSYIMGDESVQPGEVLVTSGGDRVFPRGLPVGKVAKVSMGRNLFLDIMVKPAVDLDRLEEVLIITSQKQREPDVAGLGPIRASDILAQHLPGVPQVAPGTQPGTPGAQPTATGTQPAVATPSGTQPNATHSATPNPAANTAPKPAQNTTQNTTQNANQSKPPSTQTNAARTAAQGAAPGAKPGTTPGVPHTATQSKPSAPAKPQPAKPATAEGTRPQ
jgi:rod shape-determining protein MreC